MKKIIFSTLLSLGFALTANASELDSTHGEWNVYTDGGKSCYMASIPTDEKGTFKKRGQPYVLINDKGNADEINVSSGYPYKAKVDVEAAVDGRKYKLFTQGENAWAKSAGHDKQIVTDIKSGNKLTIKGVSIKGTYSVDTYSLKGATAAYKRMKELCN